MKSASIDQELESLKTVLHALEPLDENQRQFVLKTASERLKISVQAIPASSHNQRLDQSASSANPTSVAAAGGTSLAGGTPKQFLKTKLPTTDVQRIACLAYFLTNFRSQPHFKTDDITKLNIEAGGTRLSNPSLTAKNATIQNRYLAPVGEGKKQITSLGEDVVNALPDQEAVKAVVSSQRKPRKKSSKKSVSKAK